jgi:uncharacterized protein (UPF0216 family)
MLDNYETVQLLMPKDTELQKLTFRELELVADFLLSKNHAVLKQPNLLELMKDYDSLVE